MATDSEVFNFEKGEPVNVKLVFDSPRVGEKDGRPWYMWKFQLVDQDYEEVRVFAAKALHDKLKRLRVRKGDELTITYIDKGQWKVEGEGLEDDGEEEEGPQEEEPRRKAAPRKKLEPVTRPAEPVSARPCRFNLADWLDYQAAMDNILDHLIKTWGEKLPPESIQSLAQTMYKSAADNHCIRGIRAGIAKHTMDREVPGDDTTDPGPEGEPVVDEDGLPFSLAFLVPPVLAALSLLGAMIA